MSRIPIEMRIQEFLKAKKEWERTRREYLRTRIIFEAAAKLKKLEEEGPDAISFPRRRSRARMLPYQDKEGMKKPGGDHQD